MARPGEYDFVPLIGREWSNTVSLSIFQWVYKADGHGLKKSKAIYRVKGPASKWKEINERARHICLVWNSSGVVFGENQKKSETI